MEISTRRAVISGAAAAIVAVLSTTPAATQAPPPASGAQARPPVPAGNARSGRTLYMSTGCYLCHGNEGQGGTEGPRLAPDPPPFRGFVLYVRAPRGQMPPYTAKVMTDQQLADVYAFLRTLPRPQSVDSIPLLAP